MLPGVIPVTALAWLATFADPSLLAQELRYRERQVLDPTNLEWVTPTTTAPSGPADPLTEARLLLIDNEPRKARKLLEKWLKDATDDERYEEGRQLLGECYFLEGDYWKAVENFQGVAENSSGDLFQRANERCVDVARAFLSGQKRIVWGFFRLPAYDEGIQILDRVWEREPGTRLGEYALKLRADYYFGNGDLELAQDEYANLVQQFPSGRYVQVAMLRTAEAAEAAFPGVKYDDRALLEADERYRQFKATFPAYAAHERVDARLEGIRQQRGAKDLEVARYYERSRRGDAAIYYYRLILRDWPDTLAAAQARERLQALGALEAAQEIQPATSEPASEPVSPPAEATPAKGE